MKIPNKKQTYIISALCLVFLIAGLGIGQALTPSVTFTISSGVYPGAPDYTIYTVEGTTHAKDQNGYIEFSSTNQSYVAQSCLNTGETAIYLKGAFEFTNSVLYGNKDAIIIDGSVSAANGLNAPIFQNAGSGNYGCWIEGVGGKGIIDGNSAGQSGTTARGIVFDQHGVDAPNIYTDYSLGYPNGLVLINLDIVDCRDEGLYYNASYSPNTQAGFYNVGVRMCGLTGGVNSYLQAFTDSKWLGGVIQGAPSIYGLYMMGGSFSEFGYGLYMNGPHLFEYCTGLTFEPFIMDNGGTYDTLTLAGCYDNTIAPRRMNYFGSSDNTVSGIVLQQVWGTYDCTGNNIGPIVFGTVGGNELKYGVEAVDANQDNNNCFGLMGVNVGTAVVHAGGSTFFVNATMGVVE